MPHKVNPIRFENAEANLELSNAILDSLAQTLVTSRWQRDLTDSSAQRNIGVGIGHSVLALDNIKRGLGQIDAAPEVLAADLDSRFSRFPCLREESWDRGRGAKKNNRRKQQRRKFKTK